MNDGRASLRPIEGARRGWRTRLSLRAEFALALLPTATVLGVFAFVEVLSSQPLLFASLASSAFLIYLDPQHGTNATRTLVLSQMSAAVLGFIFFLVWGPGYLAGGAAMLAAITLMILADAVHPPAVATSLSFAFRSGHATNLLLFALAVLLVSLLVALQRGAAWALGRLTADERR